jgi:hypothetical protein
MKRTYTPKEINYIKEEIRTGKPISIIADNLCVEFDRPIGGVYAKVWKLAKSTKKISKNYVGPSRRPHIRKIRPTMAKEIPNLWDFNNEQEIVIKEICEEIINKEELDVVPVQQEPAHVGIEVPVDSITFTGKPGKVIVYPDHVRYYYNK